MNDYLILIYDTLPIICVFMGIAAVLVLAACMRSSQISQWEEKHES